MPEGGEYADRECGEIRVGRGIPVSIGLRLSIE
jgi:hypothetical protein